MNTIDRSVGPGPQGGDRAAQRQMLDALVERPLTLEDPGLLEVAVAAHVHVEPPLEGALLRKLDTAVCRPDRLADGCGTAVRSTLRVSRVTRPVSARGA
jgi:hypothetical protein